MIETMIKEISLFLSLEIQTICKKESALILLGENWEFSTFSDWRILKDNIFEIGFCDKQAYEIFKD